MVVSDDDDASRFVRSLSFLKRGRPPIVDREQYGPVNLVSIKHAGSTPSLSAQPGLDPRRYAPKWRTKQ
ncbi:hypothetical protein C1S79_27900 [Mycolicibacterium phocaicum]|uniref:Uncharacterized protein n=1 Tax=Mycolicibacterium phocaicum TaxID=319706 RepID=A0AA94UC99_9MYCO|nr:hypothetical protein C1S79_27900 [Mycolicibacterium phocaicum]